MKIDISLSLKARTTNYLYGVEKKFYFEHYLGNKTTTLEVYRFCNYL